MVSISDKISKENVKNEKLISASANKNNKKDVKVEREKILYLLRKVLCNENYVDFKFSVEYYNASKVVAVFSSGRLVGLFWSWRYFAIYDSFLNRLLRSNEETKNKFVWE